MDHIEYSFNSTDGLKLYAQTWLSSHDVKGLVLLLHGLGEHGGRYTHVAKMLSEAGYITSAFDLRGHGKSEGKRGHSPSFDAFMDDIAQFIKENEVRYPDVPYFLYGHSLGTLLILNYVVRRKPNINGLIVTGPALRNELENQRGKVAIINILYRVFPSLTMPTGLDPNQLSRDISVIDAYINDPLVHDQASLSMAKFSLQSIDWLFDHAHDIHDPILILQGSLDKICFPNATKEFADKLPGDVTLKFWDGFYHEIHNEPGWEKVLEYMIEWLDSHISQT